jgi:hypothetical protein
MMAEPIGPAGYIALVLIVLFVLGINLYLVQALRGKNVSSEIDIIRKAGNTLKQPWKSEDDQLETLSDMVNRLKSNERDHLHRGE